MCPGARPPTAQPGPRPPHRQEKCVFSMVQINRVFNGVVDLHLSFMNSHYTHTHKTHIHTCVHTHTRTQTCPHRDTHTEDLELLRPAKGESQWKRTNSAQILTSNSLSPPPPAVVETHSPAVFCCVNQNTLLLMLVMCKTQTLTTLFSRKQSSHRTPEILRNSAAS